MYECIVWCGTFGGWSERSITRRNDFFVLTALSLMSMHMPTSSSIYILNHPFLGICTDKSSGSNILNSGDGGKIIYMGILCGI